MKINMSVFLSVTLRALPTYGYRPQTLNPDPGERATDHGLELEVGGAVQPGNRFVSFVRASGRGEAKLRERAGDDEAPVARAPAG